MKLAPYLILVCTSFAVYGCSMWGDPNIPNDTEILTQFKEHKKGFEELLSIIKPLPDRVHLVRESTFESSMGLTQEDWKKSIALMKKTGTKSAGTPFRHEGWYYVFTSTSYGNVSGGWSKGILYTEVKPEKIYEELNEIPQEAGRMEYLLKPIGQNWYLFLQMSG